MHQGLALAARYPGHLGVLVAHEPPLALLLPDAEGARAEIRDIYGTYRNSDTGAAWERFFTFTGIEMRPRGEGAAPQPPSGEAVATSERFFAHGLLPIALYQPDFSALQAAPTRVVVAGGTTSKGQFAQRTAVALSGRIGTDLVDFPGGHGGSHPHMVHEFVSVIKEDLPPFPDARRAAHWTCVGLYAHESALKGGRLVRLPAFTLA